MAEHPGNRTARILKSIEQLQEEINARQAELGKMKQTLGNKSLSVLDKKQDLLVKKLKDVERDQRISAATLPDVQRRIERLKQERLRQEEEDKQVNEYIWQLEKERELEELLRRKKELDKLQNHTQVLDNMIAKKQVEIDGVEKDKKIKELSRITHLDKLMKNADLVQTEMDAGVLDRKKQTLLSEYSSSLDKRSNLAREHILRDLRDKMVTRKQEISQNTNMLMHTMNMYRIKSLEKQEEKLVNRTINEGIKRHGYEFLAEVERGNKAPVQNIINTMNIDREKILNKIAAKRRPIDDLIMQNKLYVESAGEKLHEINRQIAETKQLSYQSEPRPYLAPSAKLDNHIREVGSTVVDNTINFAFKDILGYEHALDDLKYRSNDLMTRSEKHQEKIIAIYAKQAITESTDNLLSLAVKKILIDIFREFKQIEETADNMILEMLCSGVRIERKLRSSQEQMKDIYNILQKNAKQSNKRRNLDYFYVEKEKEAPETEKSL